MPALLLSFCLLLQCSLARFWQVPSQIPPGGHCTGLACFPHLAAAGTPGTLWAIWASLSFHTHITVLQVMPFL